MTLTLTQTPVTCKFLFDEEYLGDVMETCDEVGITPISILWENVPYPHTQETNNVTITFSSDDDRNRFVEYMIDSEESDEVVDYISRNS
jgi:molybdenum cofactor biosynthesis enzyme